MPASLRLEDERGEVITEYPCGWPFSFLLAADDLADTTCLRFIDDYQDTVFNSLQVPVLIRELRAAAAALSDLSIARHYAVWRDRIEQTLGRGHPAIYERPSLDSVRSCAENVIRLAERCETHTYLRFVGD